jgi:hypothetical protein
MGYPSFFPETALALLHALVYGMACMLAGASLIGLSVYSALLCSEISFPNLVRRPRELKSRNWLTVRLWPRRVSISSAVEKRILAAPNRRRGGRGAGGCSCNGQVPMSAVCGAGIQTSHTYPKHIAKRQSDHSGQRSCRLHVQSPNCLVLVITNDKHCVKFRDLQ